jgi:IS30 family transposase
LLALSLRRAKRRRKIEIDDNLRDYVIQGLREEVSPDVIAGRRKLEGLPTVSTETIYQFIYNSGVAKKQKLHLYLARKRQNRLKRGNQNRVKRYSIPDRISILERDIVAKAKTEIGHLEGDLTFNKGDQSKNIGGVVDIFSQKIFLVLNNSKQSKEVIGNMNKKLQPIEHLIKTIAFDNGKEFTRHKNLLPKSTAKVYFCDAYSPWQKPLIEKVNSMIHRIYPKTADIKLLTKPQLQTIENKLNNLPRKILGYLTPNEVWHKKLEVA